MNNYNGWKNWETWNFALHHLDLMTEQALEDLEYYESLADCIDFVCGTWDQIRDGHCEDITGFIDDLVGAYGESIDFKEIAEHIWTDVQDAKKNTASKPLIIKGN
jgi:hypothetical protein